MAVNKKFIRRASRIGNNAQLATLVSELLAQPLMLRAGVAEDLARAAMSNSNFQALQAEGSHGGDINPNSVGYEISDGIGVMYVTGAMVAHEINGLCGAQTSYEAIVETFDILQNDNSVKAIVARFNTNGGVVSQCFDAVDHIYNARGKKPMYAMVDDCAYSAGFALASPFDEVWLTRTGGVGSIGIVTRYINQEKALKNAGVEVEYIYAGDKKVWGNGSEPLSDEARKSIQDSVMLMYGMFTGSVARNMGIDEKAVIATQAGCFMGQEAIDAGFAHKLGTFDNLIEHIQGGNKMTQEEIEAKAKADAEAKVRAEMRADVREELLAEDKAKEAKAKADAEGNSPEPVSAEQRSAGIRALCASAGVAESVTNDYVASAMSTADVSDALASLTTTDTTNIHSANGEHGSDDASAVQAGWDSAIAEHSAK